MELKLDDPVLCTVTKIEGTTVFVVIDGYKQQGTIVFSEIAAGRIRNIREYVVPNKKIVCKVLKIHEDHIELSFRRVTGTERDSVMSRFKQEQTLKTMLKQIVKSPEQTLSKIKEEVTVPDFIAQARTDIKIVQKFLNKEEAEKLFKILSEKKDKEKLVKKTLLVKSESDSGVRDIREILSSKGVDIHYLGSSQFSIASSGRDFKEANQKMQKALDEIQSKAKSKKAILEIREK